MWQYTLKIALTAAIVVAISEIAKRNSFWAAALASLPLTSLLALIWLYVETGDTQKVTALAQGIFWLVIPSLLLFVLLPLLLRAGWGFWSSLGTSSVATAAAYFGMAWILERLHINT
ncbi:hypothetical protein SCD_n01815 [Sulfuricella denitrificans skB26]|uniref:DUF3147 family protein n=1 Tax=Sulfuricella denitrificans (strain DSM 22764 / NBRC 105220 / skB26) TaxID=1163617 RepID=S6AHJ9_SULDS|nr:DUF3147 family protein [Sulfuricella denitrificans]BAN35626.1 hypothetical protein SCD_n01815 [Sulfuricella denitrificans skB26]